MSTEDVAALLAGAFPPQADGLERSRSPIEGFAGSVRPSATLEARTPEDVARLLAMADHQGWAVTPVGGGTMLDLGNPRRPIDVAVGMRALDAVLDYQPDDLTLTVQAGVTLSEVHQLLASRGQSLPLDVPLPDIATVGGALATNASGPRRLRYGTGRDLVIGMQFALANGTLARSGGKVVKNVAGYDLCKMHIGALGTLGIITEVTFKLWPAPLARSDLTVAFDDAAAALQAATALLGGQLFPAALEVLEPRAAERLCGQREWILYVHLLGSSEAVQRQAAEVGAVCSGVGASSVETLSAAEGDALMSAIRDFGRAERSRSALILRASVLSSQVGHAVTALADAGLLLGSEPEMIVRPGAGIVMGYWQVADGADVAAAVAVPRSSIASLSGEVVVERAPARAQLTDCWGVTGPDLALMRRLKLSYDPAQVLNPGCFVGGI